MNVDLHVTAYQVYICKNQEAASRFYNDYANTVVYFNL